ncbi:trypsin-like serine protease [Ramicandelaber brevisporus]|nr:trypsin-like serine protease [Ramicandelaber brevisporus]
MTIRFTNLAFFVALGITAGSNVHAAPPQPSSSSASIKLWHPVHNATASTFSPAFFIANGELSSTSEFPFAVRVRVHDNDVIHSCGGSLIAPNIILSAAHCLYNKTTDSTYDPSWVEAVIFKQNGGDTGYMLEVESLETHPQYDANGFGVNDIGIIRLRSNMNGGGGGTRTLQVGNGGAGDVLASATVRISTSHIEANGQPLVAAGWGRIGSQPGSPLSPDLLRVELQTGSLDRCSTVLQRSFESNDDGLICTVGTNGRGVCAGDSGGPLLVQTGGGNGGGGGGYALVGPMHDKH